MGILANWRNSCEIIHLLNKIKSFIFIKITFDQVIMTSSVTARFIKECQFFLTYGDFSQL